MADIRSSSLKSTIALRELPVVVHLRDSADGQASLPTGFGLAMRPRGISDRRAVTRMAAKIEPDRRRVLDWYHNAPIAEFASLSAEQLVSLGRARVVIEFLRAIRRGDRD